MFIPLIKSILQRKAIIAEPDKSVLTSGTSYLVSFAGGFFGAMTHYINNLNMLLQMNFRELIDFTIHSLIGGAIMIAVKVSADWLLHIIKQKRENEN